MLISLSVSQSYAQCTPDQIAVLIGLPGVYPNPIQTSNLEPGTQGVPYSETLTIITVADTTIDLSAQVGFPVPPVTVSIDYQIINSIDGLPSGLTYACNPANCEVPGDSSGCVGISGTPDTSGVFNIVMDTEIGFEVPATVPIIGGQTIEIPIPGVSWDMDVDPVGIEELRDDVFSVAQNGPNPFSGTTTIFYNAPKPAKVAFEVFDLTGHKLYSNVERAHAGQNEIVFDATGYTPGIYLYTLSNGQAMVTHKMVVVE